MVILCFVLNVVHIVRVCLKYFDCRSCDVCVTASYYFVPAFVELTSSNVEENRRLITKHGITFPLGMTEFHSFQCY